MRCFGASLRRFPSLLHAGGEHSGAAMQRSRPSFLHLRTGVRIPPPPDFARQSSCALRLGKPVACEVCTQSYPTCLKAEASIAIMRALASPNYVYVLQSIDEPDRHYTGLSSDISSRLTWHNAGLSAHTSKHRPWKLLVTIEFADTPVAARFERYLKSGSGRAFAKRHFDGRHRPTE